MRITALLIILTLALSAICVSAQDDQDNYFTGTLVESTPDHLKVTRVLQGKSEEHIFKVNAQTKFEGGRLRLKQRVLVRYVTADEADTAILVIVRPSAQQQKGKK